MPDRDVVLKWGSYTFPINTTWEYRRTTRMSEAGKPVITTHTWTMSGTIPLEPADDIPTVQAAFEANFLGANAFGQNLVLETSPGGTDIRTLNAADCRRNGPWAKVHRQPTEPAMFATHLPFRVDVTGDTEETGFTADADLIEHEETTNYSTDRHGKITRTVAGFAITKEGVSAYGKRDSLDPLTPAGYERIRKNVKVNDPDDRIDYTFVDLQYWQRLRGNTTDGQVSTSMAQTGQTTTVRVSGNLTGPGASNEADRYQRTDMIPFSIQKTVNPRSGTCSFAYEYRYATARGKDTYAVATVTITKRGPGIQRTAIPILGGKLPPQMQVNYKTECVIDETGEITSNTQWQQPPPIFNWNAHGQGMPTRTESLGQDNLWRLSWSRSYIFANDQAVPPPDVPTQYPRGRRPHQEPMAIDAR